MRITLLLLISTVVSCQTDKKTDCNYITDYYPIIYEADLEFEAENYEKAFELYEVAFNSCKAKNTPTYNEIGNFAASSAILGKFDITYEYAKKQIQNGLELNRFQNNSAFDKFLSSDYGKKFISEYDNLRKDFIDNADLKLRDELIAMRDADQIYFRSNNPEVKEKQDSIDQLHEKRLIEIFESIGYPTDEMVGPHSRNFKVDLEILLLHTKDSIRMNYFIPKVKEFVKNGTASPKTLGRIIDQYYLYNGEPQIYGTIQNGEVSNPINDLEKVDSKRVSIGLPPLELRKKKDSINRLKYGN